MLLLLLSRDRRPVVVILLMPRTVLLVTLLTKRNCDGPDCAQVQVVDLMKDTAPGFADRPWFTLIGPSKDDDEVPRSTHFCSVHCLRVYLVPDQIKLNLPDSF